MKTVFRRWFRNGKDRIERRLDKTGDTITFEPRFAARNIHYEVSAKTGGITCGGIGFESRIIVTPVTAVTTVSASTM